MKKQLILLGCAAGLMLVPTKAAGKEDTALGKQMDAMNDAYKAFKKATDPVKGAALAREAQAAALKSVVEIPDTLKNLPDGSEKAKALVVYHKMIGKLYVTLCEVEEAFINGKMDEVTKLVDSLKEIKKSGHEKFVKEEE